MNEYWKYRAAGFSDAEVKADMLARAKAAGFTDQEAHADVFQQSISPDQQAYDLLNRPNPALLNYFGQAFAKAQTMPAPLPKAPANAQPMPDDAAIVDPAKHPGDYHDVTASPDPSIMQAAQQGYQGSVTGLLLRGKLPDALTNDQITDLSMPQRLAMQASQIGGDLPAMFLGALSGAFAQPEAAPVTATAGTFAMPAALRQILVDEYQKGEIQTPKEFMQRAAMALWAATKAGTVGAVTHGAGVAARGVAPVLQVPAEVAAMTTAGAAVEGQLPSAQDFVDGAMLVGALHGVGMLGGKAVRAAQDVTPKLRDLYARSGVKPDQVAQDAQADPTIAEDLLAMNSPKVPRAYAERTLNDVLSGKQVPADELAGYAHLPWADAALNDSAGPDAVRDKIGDLVEASESGAETPRVHFGLIDQDAADALSASTGLDITAGFKHSIDKSGILHALSEHGDKSELARGQLPITPQDLESIPEVVTTPDAVELGGRTKAGQDLVRFTKQIGDQLVVVEEVRGKRKELAFKTMWKRPAGETSAPSESAEPLRGMRTASDAEVPSPGSSSPSALTSEATQGMGRAGDAGKTSSGPSVDNQKVGSPEAKVNAPGDELAAHSPGATIPFDKDRGTMPDGNVNASGAVRVSDVVKLLQDKIGAPVRTGRLGSLGRFALGIYKPRPEVIRTKIANDITTVAHEVGHHLQRVLFGKIDPADLEPWRKELTDIATQPRKGQSPLPEGFAEFVARYIVNPEQAKAEAPKFLEAFEAKLDKDAPEIKQVLLQARETVQKWAQQPAVMRVLSHISSGESDKPPLLERAKDAMSYKAWIDRLNPINDMVKAGSKSGEKLMGDENPYTAARVYAGWTGKATEFLEAPFEFNTLQPRLATSFLEIVRAVEKHGNLDEFRAYLIAKSALERGDRGMLSEGFLNDAKTVVSELEKKAYDIYADSLYKFKDTVLDYLRDSGVVSAHTVAKMRVAWKYHVPFYRVMDEGRGAAGAGKGLQARNPIKQAHGSGRDIIDPLESIVKDTYLFVNMAERNAVVESLVHFAETHQGLGKFVEKIPTPMRGTKIHTEEILRTLKENSDLDPHELEVLFGDSDLAATIFRPNAFLDKESQIALFRDGKRTIYQVSPDIAKVINGLDQEGMGTLTRIMSYPTRLLRAGATLTPEFLTRNLTRDSFDAFIFSKYGFIPGVDTMRGLFHVLKRDDLYHDWIKSGGQHSMFVSLDRDSIQKTLQDLRQGGVMDHVRNIVKNPLEAMRILSEYSEEATRMGEYAKARAKLGNSKAAMVESGYASREVTLDFARMGAYGRILNPVIAFWNTNIQGLDKTVRSFKERPMATTMKAIAAYTLPAVMLEIANAVPESQQDQNEVLAKKAAGGELTPAEQSLYMRIQYQQLPAWERDAFLCVPAGGIIWRIPRGFELGTLFGAVSARVTRWALGKINQNATGHEFDQLLNSIGGGATPGAFPTAAAPFFENWANKSTFFDRPIVPADRENLLPELQYTPNTTQLTRSLSATIGALPNMRTLTFSPAKAENLVQGWLGGMGNYALRAADWGLRSAGITPNPTRPDMTLADMPFIRGFVARYPSANADDIQRFWNNWQDSQAYAKSVSALGKEFHPEDAIKLLGESDFNSLAGVHEAVTKQSAFIRMVEQNPELDGAKKRELIDSTYVQMLVTAKLGNMIYDNAKQAMQQPAPAPARQEATAQ